MYHSQQHRMQNCQFLYLRESFGYNRGLFVCPSCVHRVAIGRLRVCVGSILAFYQIREENRAKLKISYSCDHRVSKSARYDATFRNVTFSALNQQTNLQIAYECISKIWIWIPNKDKNRRSYGRYNVNQH